jgi:hypothetical protein
MTRPTLRAAQRSQAKPLIGFYAESGGGKTRGALTLARGFVGPSGRIVMIETESGRGESYAGDPEVAGAFDVIPLRFDPSNENADAYSPQNYGAAISEAERHNADALIVDSASHEWEGIGGVLDQAEQNKGDGKKGMQVWTQPKIDHQKHFISRLLMTPIPLVILCLRAKYPMEEKTVNGKKETYRAEHLEPKQSADILYDLFVHGWFDRATHRFHATHYQNASLAQVIRDNEPITHSTGEALARWARGLSATPAEHSKALAMVLEMVKRATTAEELAAAVAGAGELTAEEKQIVRDAYRVHPAAAKKPA